MHDRIVTRWEDWRRLVGREGTRQRTQFQRWFEHHPALVFWGDSWFSTPLYPNLATQTMARIDGVAVRAGRPGATAAQLFTDRAIRAKYRRLEAWPFDLLVLSAGGNDGLGGRLAQFFRPWQDNPSKPKISPEEAFGRLEDQGLFRDLMERFEAVLTAARRMRSQRPDFRVVAHAYAPLVRIGVPARLRVSNAGLIAWLMPETGPWLWGPMRNVLADEAAARRFADQLLVKGLKGQVLERLARRYPDLFSYADFENVEALHRSEGWYDEIHPTENGFAAMAPVLAETIRRALPEAKRAAVL